MNAHEIIRRPRLSEKTVHLQNNRNAYTFQVHGKANKAQIRDAVEELFSVKVRKVNTMNCRGKDRRTRLGTGKTADWKKAIVTLREGDVIEGV